MQNSLLRQMMDSGIVDFSLVTFSISMSPAMFSQVTTLSEPSLAYITLIWLLSGVYSHVAYHYILNSGTRVIEVGIIFFQQLHYILYWGSHEESAHKKWINQCIVDFWIFCGLPIFRIVDYSNSLKGLLNKFSKEKKHYIILILVSVCQFFTSK